MVNARFTSCSILRFASGPALVVLQKFARCAGAAECSERPTFFKLRQSWAKERAALLEFSDTRTA